MNDINDPSTMIAFKSYDPEQDDTNQFSSRYLQTLYTDYKVKIESATRYLEKIKDQQTTLTQVIEAWTHDLKNKYEILDKFQQSRPKTTIPGDFAIEDKEARDKGQDGDLKDVDDKITDNSEQINYCFGKLEDYLKFLGQTFLDAQDTINKIYDRFMEIYDNM